MEIDIGGHAGAAPPENTLLRNAVVVANTTNVRDIHIRNSDECIVCTNTSVMELCLSDSNTEEIFHVGANITAIAQGSSDENLFIAVPSRGVLKIAANCAEVLTNSVSDDESVLEDLVDLAVSSDGRVFIADNDRRGGGRILCFEPVKRTTSILLQGLNFVTGVALSPKEDYIVVAESYKCRLLRFWVKGVNTNKLDVFAARLPGPPSCLSSSEVGFWVHLNCVPTTQQTAASLWGGLLSTFSAAAQPTKKSSIRKVLVLQFNEAGSCVQNLQDSTSDGQLARTIRSMHEHESRLFLCLENGIAIYDLARNQSQNQIPPPAAAAAVIVGSSQTKHKIGDRTLHPV